MPSSLSIAMITMNEAANLPRTLGSLRLLKEAAPEMAIEVVVVDSGSTDGTVELASGLGARVLSEPWKGYAAQKNSAIAHTTGDWVLSLDADEELSPELAREIAAVLAKEPAGGTECGAYRMPRLNHFLGRALRHGGYWPDPKLRLFRRGEARFEDRPVHETMKAARAVGELRGPLIHRCYATLGEYIEHMNRYSSEGAALLASRGRTSAGLGTWGWNALLNPAATFVYNYVFRLGFLDGREGLVQHLNHAAYIHWKFVKAWKGSF